MGKRRRSLVWKISVYMTIIISALVLVVCIIYLQTFTMSAEEDAAGELGQLLIKVEENIDDNMDDAQSFLEDLAYKQEFSYFMNAKNTLSESEMNYYISSLQSSLTNGRSLYNNMFGNLGVYSSNRQIDEKRYEWQFYLDTLKQKEYFQELMNDTTDLIFGKVRNMDMVSTSLKTNKLNMGDSSNTILPIYKKIYDLNTKEIIGVIEVDLDVARISNAASLDYENGKKGVLILDDSKNVLINTMRSSDDLNHVIKEKIQLESDTLKLSHHGKNYIMSYHVLKDKNIVTVSVLNQDDLHTFLVKRVIQVLVACAVCLFFMFFIVHSFVHSMLKRLVILDDMMGKVGDGDFGVVIADDEIQDEVTRITYSFNKMSVKLNQVMEEKVQYKQAQKEAELRALQAQINPHFLYNTLENMRMQCEIDEYYTLGDSLFALGELFRYSIRWGTNEVRFEVEWENLKNYISIMQMRYGESVTFILEKEDCLNDVVVPKLIIQPLVENSFNHGFKNKIPPWEIKILAKNENNTLKLVIRDNGNGIEPDRLLAIQKSLAEKRPFGDEKQQKNSIGVTNVNQRIGLICKQGSNMTIQSETGKGTSVILMIVR